MEIYRLREKGLPFRTCVCFWEVRDPMDAQQSKKKSFSRGGRVPVKSPHAVFTAYVLREW